MLKNNKGFTLIELIAVVTIMAIIAIIATPNIINMIDNGKKEQYVSDAKEFISKATYMYKLDKYKNEENLFTKSEDGTTHQIKLTNVQDISKTEDPYGYEYQLADSYIEFRLENVNNVLKRNAYIYLVSCKIETKKDGEETETKQCVSDKYHYIKDDNNNPVESTKLTTDSVK